MCTQLNKNILQTGNCCRRLTLFPEHCTPVGTATCSICSVSVSSATCLAQHCVNKTGSLQPSASIHSSSHFCLLAGQAINYVSRTAASHPLHIPLPCLCLHALPRCHHFSVTLIILDGSGYTTHAHSFPRFGNVTYWYRV